ncbi:XkdX family protein [Mammaliicoccus vitulinus]|uniref:XkdX family protein n=1 Tax=Mammaliicoccus vitulinus TaxID=71237 RepID=UPI003F95E469
MYQTLKRLYDLKLFDKQKIFESVKCNWITKEQYTEITGEIFPQETEENDFNEQPKPYKPISDTE